MSGDRLRLAGSTHVDKFVWQRDVDVHFHAADVAGPAFTLTWAYDFSTAVPTVAPPTAGPTLHPQGCTNRTGFSTISDSGAEDACWSFALPVEAVLIAVSPDPTAGVITVKSGGVFCTLTEQNPCSVRAVQGDVVYVTYTAGAAPQSFAIQWTAATAVPSVAPPTSAPHTAAPETRAPRTTSPRTEAPPTPAPTVWQQRCTQLDTQATKSDTTAECWLLSPGCGGVLAMLAADTSTVVLTVRRYDEGASLPQESLLRGGGVVELPSCSGSGSGSTVYVLYDGGVEVQSFELQHRAAASPTSAAPTSVPTGAPTEQPAAAGCTALQAEGTLRYLHSSEKHQTLCWSIFLDPDAEIVFTFTSVVLGNGATVFVTNRDVLESVKDAGSLTLGHGSGTGEVRIVFISGTDAGFNVSWVVEGGAAGSSSSSSGGGVSVILIVAVVAGVVLLLAGAAVFAYCKMRSSDDNVGVVDALNMNDAEEMNGAGLL